MQRRYLSVIVSLILIIAIESCSKKTSPGSSVETTVSKNNNNSIIKRPDSVTTIRNAVKRKPAAAVPNVIVVNDKFANKSVDGRYYYDLQGHRYWRSNKDGKYYLFNKSMATDAAFQKPLK
jgi:hypothetical protein